MTELFFMKFGMCIEAPESILTAYFINFFHQSALLRVCPLFVARQWLGKNPLVVDRKRPGKNVTMATQGARGSIVVKALCCKPEGRGFQAR
jgi:hypothetical protein